MLHTLMLSCHGLRDNSSILASINPPSWAYADGHLTHDVVSFVNTCVWTCLNTSCASQTMITLNKSSTIRDIHNRVFVDLFSLYSIPSFDIPTNIHAHSHSLSTLESLIQSVPA